MDSGATDHLTSDLERLHVRSPYGGKDQVQVANGSGLSISHIGHSTIAGSSLRLNNILHVPHISQLLLSVYRLVSDNNIFIEFHRYFFSLLRTKPRGEFFFAVEARAASTLFRLAELSHPHPVMRHPPSRLHRPIGTSV
jgi:hypothetical protein